MLKFCILLPNWPSSPLPKAYTFPSLFKNNPCCSPQAMSMTFVCEPSSSFGVSFPVVPPMPSCPS